MPSLVDLPAEIRNTIYELILPKGHAINLEHTPKLPAICRINKQLRSEALPLWRGRNTYSVNVYWHSDFQASAILLWHLKSGFASIQNLIWTDDVFVFLPSQFDSIQDYGRPMSPLNDNWDDYDKAMRQQDDRVIGVKMTVQGASFDIELEQPASIYYGRCRNPAGRAEVMVKHDPKGLMHVEEVQMMLDAKIASMVALLEPLLSRRLIRGNTTTARRTKSSFQQAKESSGCK